MNIFDLMVDVSGATFISLCTRTVPVLRGGKINPFIGHTHKIVMNSNVMIFQNKKINGYEAMIHRRLIQEGKDPRSFVLGERQWGHRIAGTPFIEHNGNYYLEVIFLRGGVVYYEVDGVITPKEVIQGLSDPVDPDQGGLSNKVIIRSYKIESIVSLTINHNTYYDLTFTL